MAVTKTAKRAFRSSNRKKPINDQRTIVMKKEVKKTRDLINKKDSKGANKNLSTTFKALDKAAKRGVIKKGTANRKKSRLAKAVAKLEK